jgi:hypothetical protein
LIIDSSLGGSCEISPCCDHWIKDIVNLIEDNAWSWVHFAQNSAWICSRTVMHSFECWCDGLIWSQCPVYRKCISIYFIIVAWICVTHPSLVKILPCSQISRVV